MTVQQLVDVQATLRGRACSPLEASIEGEHANCHLFEVGITGP